jgi:hypothetical protein
MVSQLMSNLDISLLLTTKQIWENTYHTMLIRVQLPIFVVTMECVPTPTAPTSAHVMTFKSVVEKQTHAEILTLANLIHATTKDLVFLRTGQHTLATALTDRLVNIVKKKGAAQNLNQNLQITVLMLIHVLLSTTTVLICHQTA